MRGKTKAAGDLDEFMDPRLGGRESITSAEPGPDTEDGYFPSVRASVRMTDDEACGCPFTMEQRKMPSEMRSGRYLVPNAVATRKKRYMRENTSDPRLRKERTSMYGRSERKVFR